MAVSGLNISFSFSQTSYGIVFVKNGKNGIKKQVAYIYTDERVIFIRLFCT